MDEWIPAETAEDAIAELLALLDFNTFQIGDLEQPHGVLFSSSSALLVLSMIAIYSTRLDKVTSTFDDSHLSL
jgi:hypothetical protein